MAFEIILGATSVNINFGAADANLVLNSLSDSLII